MTKSMKKDNLTKCVKICERAEEMCFGKEWVNACYGNRMSRMMDLESAVEQFNLRLDELLEADDENFSHDVFGIWRESNRETYPATFELFVPRFSGKER